MAKFVAGEGYGFIETADGSEVYFHRNSVLDDSDERLAQDWIEEAYKIGAAMHVTHSMHSPKTLIERCACAGGLRKLSVENHVE